jgi:hypothetical protein
MTQKTELFIIKARYMIWWNLWTYFYNVKFSVCRYYILRNFIRTSLLFRNGCFLLHYISGILHLATSKLSLSAPHTLNTQSPLNSGKENIILTKISVSKLNSFLLLSFTCHVNSLFLYYFTTHSVSTALKFWWLIFHILERRIIRWKWSWKDLEGRGRALAQILPNILSVSVENHEKSQPG